MGTEEANECTQDAGPALGQAGRLLRRRLLFIIYYSVRPLQCMRGVYAIIYQTGEPIVFGYL